jgi:hypothetical protein
MRLEYAESLAGFYVFPNERVQKPDLQAEDADLVRRNTGTFTNLCHYTFAERAPHLSVYKDGARLASGPPSGFLGKDGMSGPSKIAARVQLRNELCAAKITVVTASA